MDYLPDTWYCGDCLSLNFYEYHPTHCGTCGTGREEYIGRSESYQHGEAGNYSSDARYAQVPSDYSAAKELDLYVKERQDPLIAITNPGSHFSALEELEVFVVAKCGLSDYPVAFQNGGINTATPKDSEIDVNVKRLQAVNDAFHFLQSKGFCSSYFSILKQEPDRSDVASAIRISSGFLEDALDLARKSRSSPSLLLDWDLDSKPEFMSHLILSSKKRTGPHMHSPFA
jgi:hypothetical protein